MSESSPQMKTNSKLLRAAEMRTRALPMISVLGGLAAFLTLPAIFSDIFTLPAFFSGLVLSYLYVWLFRAIYTFFLAVFIVGEPTEGMVASAVGVNEVMLKIENVPDKPIGRYMDTEFYEWIDIQTQDGIRRATFVGTQDTANGLPATLPEGTILLPPGLLYQVDMSNK